MKRERVGNELSLRRECTVPRTGTVQGYNSPCKAVDVS